MMYALTSIHLNIFACTFLTCVLIISHLQNVQRHPLERDFNWQRQVMECADMCLSQLSLMQYCTRARFKFHVLCTSTLELTATAIDQTVELTFNVRAIWINIYVSGTAGCLGPDLVIIVEVRSSKCTIVNKIKSLLDL